MILNLHIVSRPVGIGLSQVSVNPELRYTFFGVNKALLTLIGNITIFVIDTFDLSLLSPLDYIQLIFETLKETVPLTIGVNRA